MRAFHGGLMAALLASGGLTVAGEFRVHNKVYVDDQAEPASQTVTLFCGGRAYDLLGEGGEIVVFDPPNKRFVLLQPARQIRAEITWEQLEALQQRLTEKLRDQADKLGAFVLDPRFEQARGEEQDVTTFRGEWMTYEVRATAFADDEQAAAYREFATWSTRLNALKNPALLARRPINDWLASEKKLADRVQLVQYQKNLFGGLTESARFKSEHTLTPRLSREDRQRIDEVERWLVEFRRTTLGEYWETSREE